MPHQPVVVRLADLAWESWDDGDSARRGDLVWKTLFTGERTATGELTAGVAKVPPGGSLARHRHAQAEIYMVLAGVGLVEIDDTPYQVAAGTALFIPGDAYHRVSNPGPGELHLFYAFAADRFEQIQYFFEE